MNEEKPKKKAPKVVEAPAETEVVDIQKESALEEDARMLLGMYMKKNEITDFSGIPTVQKLAILQKTPPVFIHSRKVGNIQVPYVDYKFAEKALNFVFNFNVSNEIIHHQFVEGVTSGKGTKYYDAECAVKYTFKLPDGQSIIRTVFSSHRGYENPATTRGDAMKAAVSKSWTVVARTFGIGADLQEKEEKAYRKVEEAPQAPQQAQKSFSTNSPY